MTLAQTGPTKAMSAKANHAPTNEQSQLALASYYKNQQNAQRLSTEAIVSLARTSSQGQELHMRTEAYSNPTTMASHPPSKSHEPKERQ